MSLCQHYCLDIQLLVLLRARSLLTLLLLAGSSNRVALLTTTAAAAAAAAGTSAHNAAAVHLGHQGRSLAGFPAAQPTSLPPTQALPQTIP